jgi:hypothetical protein
MGFFVFMYYLLVSRTYMKDYTELKILKRGQSGTGVLIEHDAGYISPDEPRNQAFINEINKLTTDKVVIIEPLIVYVILQKYGVLNRNGRVYPKEVLIKQNEVYQAAIRERAALGELDHPESTIISGDRISHNIVETWWEGQTLMGKMEIIISPGFIKYGIISCKGDDVANMLRNRLKIGVSSRGVGSLKEGRNGEQIVQEDFEIICWDVVTAPSTPNAWIFTNIQDAKPYVEGIERKQELVEESLIKKLDNFLL